MVRRILPALASIFALLALFGSHGDSPSARTARAQTGCPGQIYVGSNNATISIDSAVAVWTSGCPSGTTLTYYVDIPSNAYHPCNDSTGYPAFCYHPFITTTNPTAWADLSRNEQSPTEFPIGNYAFYACSNAPYNTCLRSADFYLTTPVGATGNFNPWELPAQGDNGGNMMWDRNLCESSNYCNTGQEHMTGEYLDFLAYNDDSSADGDILLQNLNSYLSYPNPGDNTGGFTQLTVQRETGAITPYFFEFTHDVTYCAGYPPASPSNPAENCQATYAADGQPHYFYWDLWPAQYCQDARYQCLKVMYDTTYFAEERMQYGGDMRSGFVQSESYTSGHSSVWGAQLNYLDYSESGRVGSLNEGVKADYPYNYLQYFNGGSWNQFFWNADPNYDDYVRNIFDANLTGGYTYAVYCGPFSQSYWPDGSTPPYQSSAEWGTFDWHC